jgi:hypothetical protein
MPNDNKASGSTQISELRTAMFDQIARLNDPTLDLEKELKRANAITSVGTVIVNSVKVEIDFMRVKKQTTTPGPKQLKNGK